MRPIINPIPRLPTIDISVSVPVDDSLIDFILNYPDIFQSVYIGYWGFGYPVDIFGEKGWVVFDTEGEHSDALAIEVLKAYEDWYCHTERDISTADRRNSLHQEWSAHKQALFPDLEYFDVIDRLTCYRIHDHALQKNRTFLEDHDAEDLDWAIQMALFGDVVFG